MNQTIQDVYLWALRRFTKRSQTTTKSIRIIRVRKQKYTLIASFFWDAIIAIQCKHHDDTEQSTRCELKWENSQQTHTHFNRKYLLSANFPSLIFSLQNRCFQRFQDWFLILRDHRETSY